MCILLIEDQSADRPMVAKMLESGGHLLSLWSGATDTFPADEYDLVLLNLAPDRLVSAIDEAGRRLNPCPPVLALLPQGLDRPAGCDAAITLPPTPVTLAQAFAKALGRIPAPPTLEADRLAQLRSSLDPRILGQLLETACNSIEEMVAQLETMRADGASGELARAAHRLAGVAANFGCRALAGLAERIEKQASPAAIPWNDLRSLAETATEALRAEILSPAEAG